MSSVPVVSAEAEKLVRGWLHLDPEAFPNLADCLTDEELTLVSLISSALEAARREEREQCCAALCDGCKAGIRIAFIAGVPIHMAQEGGETYPGDCRAFLLRSRPTPKAPSGAPTGCAKERGKEGV